MNTIYLNETTNGQYFNKIGVVDVETFNNFKHKLRVRNANRVLSGKIDYDTLNKISDTLSSFMVETSKDFSLTMVVDDWKNMSRELELTKKEAKDWIFIGIRSGIMELIDEDLNYGEKDEFLHDLLCLFSSMNFIDRQN